jgi:carbonic anhydrase
MQRLLKVEKPSDIPAGYRKTPVGLLFEYHNLRRAYDDYTQAKLLIGMCMDNRKHLHIPPNFAFIIRSGGANLRTSEFKVSYAISVGGVEHIALIGHNHCGMVCLTDRKKLFVDGLVKRGGWTKKAAEEHFESYAPIFEIGNEIDFVLSETQRLRCRYPKIKVAPLLYKVEDNKLYFIAEKPIRSSGGRERIGKTSCRLGFDSFKKVLPFQFLIGSLLSP